MVNYEKKVADMYDYEKLNKQANDKEFMKQRRIDTLMKLYGKKGIDRGVAEYIDSVQQTPHNFDELINENNDLYNQVSKLKKLVGLDLVKSANENKKLRSDVEDLKNELDNLKEIKNKYDKICDIVGLNDNWD